MRKCLILSLLGLFSLNTYAVDVTNGPLQQDPSLCAYGYNSNCNRGNNSQYSLPPKKVIETTIIHKASKYGALAYSAKGGYIDGALNKNSKSEAIQSAKALCEKGSKGHPCKVNVWVRNGCVAAAIGTLKGKSIITPAAEAPGKAESVALSRCKATGAKTCEILMPEGCSIPDGMYD